MSRKVAAYISSKVDEACSHIINKKNNIKLFNKILKRVWKNNDSRVFFIPKEYSCYSNIKVKFTNNNSSSFDGRVITISISKIINSKSTEELKTAFIIVKSIIYHEVEHFLHSGSRVGPGKDKLASFSKYLSNKGEIRAHARMFSVLYGEIFSGQKFDINKLISIGRDMKIPSILYYFEVFSMNKFIKRYPFVKGVKKKISVLTAQFTKEYENHKGIL